MHHDDTDPEKPDVPELPLVAVAGPTGSGKSGIALDLAETVTLLNYGRVIVDGDRDAVIADERTREVYLGV